MKPVPVTIFVFGMMSALSCSVAPPQRDAEAGFLLKNVKLINGLDSLPYDHTDILIQGDTIAAIGTGLKAPNATVTDLTGKTIMPALISAHVHVGVLKGTSTSAENYTRQNLIDQLKKYADYGVLTVQTMGTDRPMLFQDNLYDSVRTGLLPGARLLSAGYGFGVPEDNLSMSSPMNYNPFKGYSHEERDVRSKQVREQIKDLAQLEGAILIRRDGVAVAACIRIEAPPDPSITLSMGLGTRHAAAARITCATEAIAITVSQSGGIVRLWQNGEVVLHIVPSQRQVSVYGEVRRADPEVNGVPRGNPVRGNAILD